MSLFCGYTIYFGGASHGICGTSAQWSLWLHVCRNPRRQAHRNGTYLLDDRAGTRWLGGGPYSRRCHGCVHRVPRRHVQLPGRNNRGTKRLLGRSYGAQSGPWREGRFVAEGMPIGLPHSGQCFLTCCFNRSRYAAWGSAGGLDGSPNYVNIIRSEGSVSRQVIVDSCAWVKMTLSE